MDRWQKAQSVLVSVSAVAVPVVLAYVGHQFNAAIKEREAQSKFVELAVSILVQPVQEENRLLRVWATEVVNRYSGVKLGEQTRSQLIDKLSFPTVPGKSDDIYTALLKGGGFELIPDARPLLAELGYYVAPVTAGETLKEEMTRTADAVRRFQQDRGLPVRGWIDSKTLEELRRAVQRKRAQTDRKK